MYKITTLHKNSPKNTHCEILKTVMGRLLRDHHDFSCRGGDLYVECNPSIYYVKDMIVTTVTDEEKIVLGLN